MNSISTRLAQRKATLVTTSNGGTKQATFFGGGWGLPSIAQFLNISIKSNANFEVRLLDSIQTFKKYPTTDHKVSLSFIKSSFKEGSKRCLTKLPCFILSTSGSSVSFCLSFFAYY